jgi:solute carrier family 27 fatty acid transporter 1/4
VLPLPVLLPFVYPVSLIRVNEEGEPVRDKSGVCIRCLPGEAGEFVGKIVKGEVVLISALSNYPN